MVENVQDLRALYLPTDEWYCLLTFLVKERLDGSTRRHWELATGDHENPSFDDLKDFIEKQCQALEAVGQEINASAATKIKSKHMTKKYPTTTSYHMAATKCAKCGAQHPLYSCGQFLKLLIEDRIRVVKSSSLCFNCMKANHTAKQCKSQHCGKCHRHHNTLLHREVEKKDTSSTDETTVRSHHTQNHIGHTQVLLATALVNIQDSSRKSQKIKALLDSGSQPTFITSDCVQRLGLRKHKTNITIGGLGATGVGTCKGMVQLHMSSMQTSYACNIQALILQRVSSIMLGQPVDISAFSDLVHIHHLNLADPKYY